jgi:hypothetical protein
MGFPCVDLFDWVSWAKTINRKANDVGPNPIAAQTEA